LVAKPEVAGKVPVSRYSEPEIGEVAIADGGAGARHQEAVKGDDETGKQAGCGDEWKGGGLRHRFSQSVRSVTLTEVYLRIPDTRDNLFECIAAIAFLQCNRNATIGISNR
jgi:hypothetical protein